MLYRRLHLSVKDVSDTILVHGSLFADPQCIVHNISKPDNNPHAILYWYSYKRNVKKSLWCRYCCLRGDKPLTVWDRGEETLIPQTVFPTCETSSSPECRAGDQSQVVWRWLWSPHVNMFTHKVTHNTIQKNKQDSRVSSSYP